MAEKNVVSEGSDTEEVSLKKRYQLRPLTTTQEQTDSGSRGDVALLQTFTGLPVTALPTQSGSEAPSVRSERMFVDASSESQDSQKSRRAKALASVDSNCLFLLTQINERPVFPAAQLNNLMTEPKQWLNIARLVRADFLETLDSSVRITQEGQQALRNIASLRSFPGE